MYIRDEMLTTAQAAVLLECAPGDLAWLEANHHLAVEWVCREPSVDRRLAYYSRGEIERRRRLLIRRLNDRAAGLS